MIKIYFYLIVLYVKIDKKKNTYNEFKTRWKKEDEVDCEGWKKEG